MYVGMYVCVCVYVDVYHMAEETSRRWRMCAPCLKLVLLVQHRLTEVRVKADLLGDSARLPFTFGATHLNAGPAGFESPTRGDVGHSIMQPRVQLVAICCSTIS